MVDEQSGPGAPALLPWESPDEVRVVDRTVGRTGGELVLRRAGSHWEVVSNGVFLMDTRDGASEREMVRAALAGVAVGRRDAAVLIGGLGVGFSAREALDDPRVARVRVVELEPRVVEWHSGPLAPVAGRLAEDPRCQIDCADVVDWLAATAETFDAVCLDVDNGPDWTVVEGNGRLYLPEALGHIRRVLRPGGAVAFWSAMPAPGFADLLARRFGRVRTVEVPARRGGPDVVYLAHTAP
ncbi:spermidine synthase [Marinitenerispora sediminis]|uniref:Spermidine synthase n=1 Tax=Marinitenerispora sediminis TaxID=1931232 RepID=A0A368T133_9ACTN|nr:spermidine synthase [Marinitenerispora sediminis]RCV47780.1 spermidine synthase [Marinitenerispora sediminis]RCV50766.1 spermidine synthase [Marinitenerispora sediminis]RCV53609.1 spermidine synthase [Marinitenerispora sediminis]